MQSENKIILLSSVGKILENDFLTNPDEELYIRTKNNNAWFTKDNVQLAVKGIVEEYFNEQKLTTFLNNYSFADNKVPKTVGIVAAGNIPFVGIHDLICGFLSGNNVNIKLSSSDSFLMRYFISKLYEMDISITKSVKEVQTITSSDAYIATGSDNSSRYFDFYFSKKPSIIRRNRTSVAVLTGNESKIDLSNLGNDIFQYFGLGCRNISKIFVPKGYDFQFLYESIEYWSTIQMHHKYNNNYDYNKSIYLVNKEPHFDNGFLLIKQSPQLVSPLSVLYYEEYESEKELSRMLNEMNDKLQCIVGNGPEMIPFGHSQKPTLFDYADRVDTMRFLIGL